MHNLSMTQALDVWSDLEAALYGKNQYGGHTAEIYMYRLMPHSPALSNGGSSSRVEELYRQAAASLIHLLKHFNDTHECIIQLEGRALKSWRDDAIFDHRVHVQITRSR